MEFIAGKRYVVKKEHPFHGNKAGIFEFMGGPNADVVVLCDEKAFCNQGFYKNLFCVAPQDIEKQED